ncbi:hypothetical protein CPB83DRAFT_810589 [Crepidotus variabilis]|uniref:RING-type domain-containing protein n=1 Tax=Crepidotus variabilis TaxID=179855 RepID=A0A9P6EIJ2_9AGAR|nr:hypothetical protein CPB83DRAFT_810589 [Crepidotus variabilis]
MSHCSICISSCTDPVSLPCGHIYCRQCIASYATTHRTALTAKCPKCREPFHLSALFGRLSIQTGCLKALSFTVTPDLSHIATKFHPFVTPPVRRVYIDNAEQTRLEQKSQELEQRIAFYSNSDKSLTERYEALAAVVDGHRQGERDANNRIMELEQVIQGLEDGQAEQVKQHTEETKEYRKQVAQLTTSNITLSRSNGDLRSKFSKSRKQIEKYESEKKGFQKRIEELITLTSLVYPSQRISGNPLFGNTLVHDEAKTNTESWGILDQPFYTPTRLYLTGRNVSESANQTSSSTRQTFY